MPTWGYTDRGPRQGHNCIIGILLRSLLVQPTRVPQAGSRSRGLVVTETLTILPAVLPLVTHMLVQLASEKPLQQAPFVQVWLEQQQRRHRSTSSSRDKSRDLLVYPTLPPETRCDEKTCCQATCAVYLCPQGYHINDDADSILGESASQCCKQGSMGASGNATWRSAHRATPPEGHTSKGGPAAQLVGGAPTNPQKQER